MGKGFQNFMSKKDFHPSAWWNIKKVWEARQKQDMETKRQDELRVQYEKEQEMLQNKALLGDEKAKLGLSFMYDAPAGINKREEEKPEPKFEWQRKYNAPREEWAKGNEDIQDQPFGIQVRNVRCVRCRTWGHLNTDRECPLYNMSGTADDQGYANNPSDLMKQMRRNKTNGVSDQPSSSKTEPDSASDWVEVKAKIKKEKKIKVEETPHQQKRRRQYSSGSEASDDSEEEEDEEPKAPMNRIELAENMKEEHGLQFKSGIMKSIVAEQGLSKLSEITKAQTEEDEFKAFCSSVPVEIRMKIWNKIAAGGGDDSKFKKKMHKKMKKEKKKEKKAKKDKKEKEKKSKSHSERRSRKSSSSSSDSDSEKTAKSKKDHKRRHDSSDLDIEDDRRSKSDKKRKMDKSERRERDDRRRDHTMGDFVPRFEREMESRSGPKQLPTSGAILVKNEKGQETMQKVKVVRYKAGQRPAYAQESSSGSERESDSGDERERHHHDRHHHGRHDRDRYRERRAVAEPELIRKGRRPVDESDEEAATVADELRPESESEDEEEAFRRRERARARALERRGQQDDDEEDEDMEEVEVAKDDDEAELDARKRAMLKARAKQREEQELLQRQQEGGEEVSDESDEDEDEEESDEEDEEEEQQRFKPVFVNKKDRVTLIEAEKEAERLKQLELEEEERKNERKKESVRMAQETIRREDEQAKAKKEDPLELDSVVTDDENEEIEYELWKLREMKRIKRDRDEREQLAKEKAEMEKIHNMTEEERLRYLKANPKIVTNKQDKGKYKFLQKYYHRGAFFLDQEEDILKRNFAEATLDDQFDKSILPKVMQVKNFGKASRSKWTHLTAEDTTDHQGTWATATAQSTKDVVSNTLTKGVFFSEKGLLCYDFKQIRESINATRQYFPIQLGNCVGDVFRFWDTVAFVDGDQLGNCVKDRLFRFWDTVAFVDGDQVKLAARGFRFSQFGEQIFVIRGVFSLDATTWIYASVNDRRAKHFHHYELYASGKTTPKRRRSASLPRTESSRTSFCFPETSLLLNLCHDLTEISVMWLESISTFSERSTGRTKSLLPLKQSRCFQRPKMHRVNLTRFLALAAYLIFGAMASNDSSCQPGSLLTSKDHVVYFASCRDVRLFEDRPREAFVGPFCEKKSTRMFVSKRGVVHLAFSADSDSKLQKVRYTLYSFPEKSKPSQVLQRQVIDVCHPNMAMFHSEKTLVPKQRPVMQSVCTQTARVPPLVDVLTGDIWSGEGRSAGVIHHAAHGALTVQQRFGNVRRFYWIPQSTATPQCIFEARGAESIIVVSSNRTAYENQLPMKVRSQLTWEEDLKSTQEPLQPNQSGQTNEREQPPKSEVRVPGSSPHPAGNGTTPKVETTTEEPFCMFHESIGGLVTSSTILFVALLFTGTTSAILFKFKADMKKSREPAACAPAEPSAQPSEVTTQPISAPENESATPTDAVSVNTAPDATNDNDQSPNIIASNAVTVVTEPTPVTIVSTPAEPTIVATPIEGSANEVSAKDFSLVGALPPEIDDANPMEFTAKDHSERPPEVKTDSPLKELSAKDVSLTRPPN
ncbi:hypothetical protein QR680_011046 [Steinernema hermaphroditum]|uniref:CBF1-interacting co-repressor CIR N-terminal domain-containing protein n=1 Tax=Steinernema hermaphroditum TaxID=289476 RepID=A0AA39IS40_9BILA|nr:hypothetical protein QR680_011046 [Steinernema hermaphroditum]